MCVCVCVCVRGVIAINQSNCSLITLQAQSFNFLFSENMTAALDCVNTSKEIIPYTDPNITVAMLLIPQPDYGFNNCSEVSGFFLLMTALVIIFEILGIIFLVYKPVSSNTNS